MFSGPLSIAVLSIVWTVALVASYLIYRRVHVRHQCLDRCFEEEASSEDVRASRAQGGWLAAWLALAGFRNRGATTTFVLASLLSLATGLSATYLIHSTGIALNMVQALSKIPGGVGDLLLPIAYVSPWFLFLTIAMAPWLAVRKRRRHRVMHLEQDLPTALDLLATLSEAGLAFDAAVSQILETRLGIRPLGAELRAFQADTRVGRPRVECLRRLASRVQVQSVSIVVSALVQSHQLGTGIAGVLRRQADDLRDRRREQANAFAMTLPVKRMFPLVVCFLPGPFVWTLGPAFVQLFKLSDTILHMRNF